MQGGCWADGRRRRVEPAEIDVQLTVGKPVGVEMGPSQRERRLAHAACAADDHHRGHPAAALLEGRVQGGQAVIAPHEPLWRRKAAAGQRERRPARGQLAGRPALGAGKRQVLPVPEHDSIQNFFIDGERAPRPERVVRHAGPTQVVEDLPCGDVALKVVLAQGLRGQAIPGSGCFVVGDPATGVAERRVEQGPDLVFRRAGGLEGRGDLGDRRDLPHQLRAQPEALQGPELLVEQSGEIMRRHLREWEVRHRASISAAERSFTSLLEPDAAQPLGRAEPRPLRRRLGGRDEPMDTQQLIPALR